MRLFIAVYPPKEVRDYFRDVIRELDKQKRNIRTIDLEQMHLTLRFVGSHVHPGSKDIIVRELLAQAGDFPKPEIEISRLRLGFPRQHDPRILFAEVKRNHELDELVDRLHKTIRGLRRMDTIQWKQQHDHHYHITMGRLKDSATRSTGRDVIDLIRKVDIPFPAPFAPEEMYVVQSEMQKNAQPVYKRLEKITL